MADWISCLQNSSTLSILNDWLCFAGDALYDMKQKLNVTGGQLSDWNQNQVNPCTWNSVICDNSNNVIQV